MGNSPSRDLDGLLVISLEQAVAAPYAASRLADAGARVIKVERPEGDFARGYDADANGHSSYFVWLNRGKESVALDLKQPDDLQIFKQMLSKADVFIQNLMPGALDRLGVSMADLRQADPRLITCDISGYGASGPFAQMKAYDFLVQAEVGLAQITGAPEEPGRVGVSICDIAAGMTAHAAILQALVARAKTGEGRAIEVSLFHALADWMNVPYLQHHYGGREIRRPGLHHPTIAPYGAYRCGDDRMLLISIQNEREWLRLCSDVLNQPDLPQNPKFDSNVHRVENRASLDAIMNGVFSQYSIDKIADKLQAAQIAFGRLNDMDVFTNHPQNRFVSVRTSAGDVQLLSPGAIVNGVLPTLGEVPDLGQHSAAIRAEFS
ncbi:CaiB/BaiF CoA-transferase family protein [Alphaproteobacteria bacterium]|jgi:crotonobetainyl-CoA:carnitine CoA-transferase CaiB-like acyl-CoA transferase|nr:CoA transferase [Alphaproteobacteria bacterium]MDA8873623.1 CoA transferase [Alphaproteobacteria bacterium]MDA8942457.1 CoA transferase [Alphaproteobacteria bacterium]MDA9012946.1 CoA transferase [Alphaproteobacteria bacterium]MDA9824271.1 CoA transferase [Alphaproteobacteria bacterium]